MLKKNSSKNIASNLEKVHMERMLFYIVSVQNESHTERLPDGSGTRKELHTLTALPTTAT